MKKTLAVLLTTLMVLSCLPAFALDLLPAGDTYPLDTDVSLTWFASEGFGDINQAYAMPSEVPFCIGMSEMTGVDIEFQYRTAGTEPRQAENLVLAREVLPDIIFGQFMKDAARLMEEGVIRDLTDYIQEYAPAYYHFLQSNPAYDNAMKTDEGKYYGFGFFREDGGWNDTYQGPVVRKDWLDEQGLEPPVTISDWTNVLTVFKEKYGATFTAPWSRLKQSGISGAFGAFGMSDFQLFIDDNGKVQLSQAQPEWFDYLLQLNEWWDAGLIDQDVLTQTDTDAKTKALQGSTGLAYTSMGQMSSWRREATEANTGADWVGMQYPHGDDGTLSMVFGGYGIGVVVSCISGDCSDEKLITALRVLDYAYTQEGFLYWNYGKQGVSWDYDENGEPAYLPLVTEDPNGISDAISKYGGSTWSGSCIQSTKLLYMKNTPQSIEANDLWYYPNMDVSSKWKMPPGVTMTADESSEYDFLQSTIATFVAETCAKLVTGEMKKDDFPAYLEQLNGMGLQTILDIQQAAYDRFLAR